MNSLSWACPSCHFKNNELLPFCEICDARQPEAPISKSEPSTLRNKVPDELPEVDSTTWDCVKCTFVNHLDLDICEVCETPKSKSGWVCERCTRFNSLNVQTCKACKCKPDKAAVDQTDHSKFDRNETNPTLERVQPLEAQQADREASLTSAEVQCKRDHCTVSSSSRADALDSRDVDHSDFHPEDMGRDFLFMVKDARQKLVDKAWEEYNNELGKSAQQARRIPSNKIIQRPTLEKKMTPNIPTMAPNIPTKYAANGTKSYQTVGSHLTDNVHSHPYNGKEDKRINGHNGRATSYSQQISHEPPLHTRAFSSSCGPLGPLQADMAVMSAREQHLDPYFTLTSTRQLSPQLPRQPLWRPGGHSGGTQPEPFPAVGQDTSSWWYSGKNGVSSIWGSGESWIESKPESRAPPPGRSSDAPRISEPPDRRGADVLAWRGSEPTPTDWRGSGPEPSGRAMAPTPTDWRGANGSSWNNYDPTAPTPTDWRGTYVPTWSNFVPAAAYHPAPFRPAGYVSMFPLVVNTHGKANTMTFNQHGYWPEDNPIFPINVEEQRVVPIIQEATPTDTSGRSPNRGLFLMPVDTDPEQPPVQSRPVQWIPTPDPDALEWK